MPEEFRIQNNNLANGQMRSVRAGPTDVLLININGTVHAVEPLCPHYKQPLADGLVCGGELRCGWHQSTFDVASGSVLEPPALTGLKKYPVRVDGDDLLIDVASYRTDRRHFVIIGGGAAGFSAAKTLRGNGFEGELTIISADGDPPYDRPNLSKDFLANKPLDAPLPLADETFYKTHRIDLRLDRSVQSVDRMARTTALDDGSTIPFDQLLIATGASPRTLDVPGAKLAGIHTLRSLRDASLLGEAANASHAVIIGGSFFAIEAAAALRHRGLAVTVVMRDTLPLRSTLGDEIATMIRDVHQKQGVKFRGEQSVKQFDGQHRVRAVKLADGSSIECDLALVAIGVRPNTDFLASSFAEFIEPDGGLRVDRHMRLCDGIYAAGDVAHGELGLPAWNARIEHWRVAEQLGTLAAMNMLGQESTFSDVPYFWTYQFDLGLDYIGHVSRWDEIIIDGDVQKQDFVACYRVANQIDAVCASGRPEQVCAIAELMKRRRMPSADAVTASVASGGFDYVRALRQISLP